MREHSPREAQAALKMTRLQRIFTPGRFSLSVIVACLQNDIPVPFDDKFLRIQGLCIATAVQTVCSMCERWARERFSSDGNDFERDKDRTGVLDYLDLCFFEFTRLCHLRQVAVDAKISCGASWADPRVAASLVPGGFCVLLPNEQGFYVLSLPREALQGHRLLQYQGYGGTC